MRPVPIASLSRPPHRASAPGEPPSTDYGNLIAAVGTQALGPGRAAVGVTRAGFYWKWLEYGTRFMEPRPFVRIGLALAKAGMSKQFIRRMRAETRKILAKRRKARGGRRG